jgi:hypothetical protein
MVPPLSYSDGNDGIVVVVVVVAHMDLVDSKIALVVSEEGVVVDIERVPLVLH